MRPRPFKHLEDYRQKGGGKDDRAGLWMLGTLRVVASWGHGWEHAIVSRADADPSLQEIQNVRRMLWEPDEIVVVFVGLKPIERTVHLWRSMYQRTQTPPAWMDGSVGTGTMKKPNRAIRELIAAQAAGRYAKLPPQTLNVLAEGETLRGALEEHPEAPSDS